ncbi:MAG: PAS domain-containing protein [Bacteroidetes bacterium]|nr:PAS domain-containing protein [Bacteroidota bacterium]
MDESGRISRLQGALAKVNQALLRLRSREELLEQVCDVMVRHGGYIITWMGWLNPRTHIVVPAAFSGQTAEKYLIGIRVTVDEDALGKGPTGTALREGKSFVCNDFRSDERTRPWWESGKKAGIRSSAAFPFRCKGEVCGTLNVYSGEANVFGQKEVSILEEIAVDISVALDRIDEDTRRLQSVKAHEEGEERFRGFAEASEQVFWISSLHPELILYVNPAFERVWGRPVSDLYRSPRIWTDSIYIDDRARIIEDYSNWTLGIPGSKYDVEYRLVKPTGEIRWIADHGFVLRSEENRILQVGGIAEDITDRKQAEEELQRSEERFRQALDNMIEGCMIIGSDWTYLYVNDAAARHGRQKKENLIGHTMMEMYPGVEDTEVFARYRSCMLESIPQEFESKFVFLDGTINWYEFIVNPVPEGIFVLSLDITDRKRVLEALVESEETLREAQNLAHLGNWRLDLLTNKFSCSDELLMILELEPNEFIGTFDEFLGMIHQDDRPSVERIYKKSIDDRTSSHISHRMLLRDGRTKLVMQQFTTFYDNTGRPIRSVGTLQDVTDREKS